MNTTLVYVLFLLPAQGWQGSVELHTTADQARCEHLQVQLQAVARPGARYRCETLVTSTAQALK